MEFLHHDHQQQVIDKEIEQANNKITEQLYPPFHVGIAEHNILRHKEPNRESDAEGKKQRSIMSFEGIEAKMKHLFEKDILVTDKINDKSQQCIATTGCCIPEGLQVHQPFKRRIEKINYGKNKVPGTMYMSSHLRGKGKRNKCQISNSKYHRNLPIWFM